MGWPLIFPISPAEDCSGALFTYNWSSRPLDQRVASEAGPTLQWRTDPDDHALQADVRRFLQGRWVVLIGDSSVRILYHHMTALLLGFATSHALEYAKRRNYLQHEEQTVGYERRGYDIALLHRDNESLRRENERLRQKLEPGAGATGGSAEPESTPTSESAPTSRPPRPPPTQPPSK